MPHLVPHVVAQHAVDDADEPLALPAFRRVAHHQLDADDVVRRPLGGGNAPLVNGDASHVREHGRPGLRLQREVPDHVAFAVEYRLDLGPRPFDRRVVREGDRNRLPLEFRRRVAEELLHGRRGEGEPPLLVDPEDETETDVDDAPVELVLLVDLGLALGELAALALRLGHVRQQHDLRSGVAERGGTRRDEVVPRVAGPLALENLVVALEGLDDRRNGLGEAVAPRLAELREHLPDARRVVADAPPFVEVDGEVVTERRPLYREEAAFEDEQHADREHRHADGRVDDVDEQRRELSGDVEHDRQPDQDQQRAEGPGVVPRFEEELEDHEQPHRRQHVRQARRGPVEHVVFHREVYERRRHLTRGEVRPVDGVRGFDRDHGEEDGRARSPERRVAVVAPSGVGGTEVEPRPHGGEPDGESDDVRRHAERIGEQEPGDPEERPPAGGGEQRHEPPADVGVLKLPRPTDSGDTDDTAEREDAGVQLSDDTEIVEHPPEGSPF